MTPLDVLTYPIERDRPRRLLKGIRALLYMHVHVTAPKKATEMGENSSCDRTRRFFFAYRSDTVVVRCVSVGRGVVPMNAGFYDSRAT